VTALRIKRLSLTDFRAFPGPAPTHFELEGKNLLVYGENGAGKSSIFHALSGFFSLKPARSLRDHKNVFSGQPDTDCRVAVEFTDGTVPVEWSVSTHPGAVDLSVSVANWHQYFYGNADPRVVTTALRRTSLDYRALLDTNYKHGDGAINLFGIAVEHLLHDFPVVIEGGQNATIGELWAKVLRAKPSQHTSGAITRINQACLEFNTAFRGAFTALLPHINALMHELGWHDVEFKGFQTPGLTYNNARLKQNRAVEGQVLTPDLTFRNHPLPAPQVFLNEARLSALGLAIYLAGRLACTPTAEMSALKLLVLDDVLIGLDHSNRLPVLDVLRKHFADWQVVLLTHDRVWFEMARFYLGNTGYWKCLEVFEGEDVVRGIPAPTVRAPGDKAAKASLDQARAFLADHHIPAAANYTRAAFELALKSFCERFGVPVTFKTDPRHLDTEKLLSAAEGWFKTHSAKNCLAGVIERVKLFRKVVLNPYSHASPPNIARAEVEGAISAVEQLLEVVDVGGMDGDPIQAAQALIAKTPSSAGDLHAALGFLRAAFFGSLRRFCDRKHMRIAFKEQAVDGHALWQAAIAHQATLFAPPHGALPGQIDAERRWLISPATEADLTAVTQADLARLVALLVPAGGAALIFDTL
jgi:energy-coupling factor transporter ATP-binding protein EcfA2